MSTHDEILAELAGQLAARRDYILECVRRRIVRDSQIPSSANLNRQAFLDHLPQLLKNLEGRMRVREPTSVHDALERRPAEAHGEQRWEQGYSLVETMDEWRHLYACISDELAAWVTEMPELPAAAALTASVRATAFIEEGMRSSAHSYTELQRADAVRRAKELEAALEEVKTLERHRVSSWRQALHDLRGSVGAISSASRLLAHPGASPETLQRSQESLAHGLVSVRDMLNELTTLARLEARVEPLLVTNIDVAAMLRELAASLQPSAIMRGLALHAEGPARLEVQGDSIKIQRIAQNLLQNALKYTKRGSVSLRWWADPSPNAARNWTLTVTDTGLGLPSKNAPAQDTSEAMPAFTDTSEGLGLTIVRRLCDVLLARLVIDSAPDRGTVIQVTFPSKY